MYLKEERSSEPSYSIRYFIADGDPDLRTIESGGNPAQISKLEAADPTVSQHWTVDPDNAEFTFISEATIHISAFIVYDKSVTATEVESGTRLYIDKVVGLTTFPIAYSSQNNISVNIAVNFSISTSATLHLGPGDKLAVLMAYKSTGDAVNCITKPRSDDNVPVSMIVLTYLHL